MTFRERIEINPLICSGKPVIRGTRVIVSDLLSQLAEGQTFDDLKRGYPDLKEEDIRAALEYAAATVKNVEVDDLT